MRQTDNPAALGSEHENKMVIALSFVEKIPHRVKANDSLEVRKSEREQRNVTKRDVGVELRQNVAVQFRENSMDLSQKIEGRPARILSKPKYIKISEFKTILHLERILSLAMRRQRRNCCATSTVYFEHYDFVFATAVVVKLGHGPAPWHL